MLLRMNWYSIAGVNDKLVNEKLGDLSLEDSVDSSYGSMTPSTQFCSSMPSDSWESELQNYSDISEKVSD